MWLNEEKISDGAIKAYRTALLSTCPKHIVIDNLFDSTKLDKVMDVLHQDDYWQTQKHTYDALYVDNELWQNASDDERFVLRDVWQREALGSGGRAPDANIAYAFLSFLRGDEFLSCLSRVFNVPLTDMHVAKPDINTNYFRLSPTDFVKQHADDSPGRVVCMLLYLNQGWRAGDGGELVFSGAGGVSDNDSVYVSGGVSDDYSGDGAEHEQNSIAPLYNRCVLFDPSSKGSEHWVQALNPKKSQEYRYNVTSWYWSE